MPYYKKSRTVAAKRRRGGTFANTLRRMLGLQPRLTNAEAARIREERLNAIHPPTRTRTASKAASKPASPRSKTAKKTRSPKK